MPQAPSLSSPSIGITFNMTAGYANAPSNTPQISPELTQLTMAVVMALITMIKSQSSQAGAAPGGAPGQTPAFPAQGSLGASPTATGGTPGSTPGAGPTATPTSVMGASPTAAGGTLGYAPAGASPAGGPAATPTAVMGDVPAARPRGGEQDMSKKPSADETRPPGDTRSAEQIVDDNPVLKDLGDQRDIHRDKLKQQCGDWENDPDPQKRADAAYRAAHVLNYIDNAKTSAGDDRQGDGDIQGITADQDARHGTEAGMLKDFGEQGYGYLPEPDVNALPTTGDDHVNANGSTQDETEWARNHPDEAAGKVLQQVGTAVQDCGQFLDKTLGKIPVLGDFVHLGNLAATALGGGINVAGTAAAHGDVDTALKDWGADTAGAAVETAVSIVDPTELVAGAAGQMTSDAIKSGYNGQEFDPAQSVVDSVNPLSAFS